MFSRAQVFCLRLVLKRSRRIGHSCIEQVLRTLGQTASGPAALNEDKTEAILFGTSGKSGTSPLGYGTLSLHFRPVVKDLVIFDNDFRFGKHIEFVVKNIFFKLRLLGNIKPFLSHADPAKAVHAFISSRRDF